MGNLQWRNNWDATSRRTSTCYGNDAVRPGRIYRLAPRESRRPVNTKIESRKFHCRERKARKFYFPPSTFQKMCHEEKGRANEWGNVVSAFTRAIKVTRTFPGSTKRRIKIAAKLPARSSLYEIYRTVTSRKNAICKIHCGIYCT